MNETDKNNSADSTEIETQGTVGSFVIAENSGSVATATATAPPKCSGGSTQSPQKKKAAAKKLAETGGLVLASRASLSKENDKEDIVDMDVDTLMRKLTEEADIMITAARDIAIDRPKLQRELRRLQKRLRAGAKAGGRDGMIEAMIKENEHKLGDIEKDIENNPDLESLIDLFMVTEMAKVANDKSAINAIFERFIEEDWLIPATDAEAGAIENWRDEKRAAKREDREPNAKFHAGFLWVTTFIRGQGRIDLKINPNIGLAAGTDPQKELHALLGILLDLDFRGQKIHQTEEKASASRFKDKRAKQQERAKIIEKLSPKPLGPSFLIGEAGFYRLNVEVWTEDNGNKHNFGNVIVEVFAGDNGPEIRPVPGTAYGRLVGRIDGVDGMAQQTEVESISLSWVMTGQKDRDYPRERFQRFINWFFQEVRRGLVDTKLVEEPQSNDTELVAIIPEADDVDVDIDVDTASDGDTENVTTNSDDSDDTSTDESADVSE